MATLLVGSLLYGRFAPSLFVLSMVVTVAGAQSFAANFIVSCMGYLERTPDIRDDGSSQCGIGRSESER